MYSAAPISRLTQTGGLAATSTGSVWMTGLTTIHVIVAVTSLVALTLAMGKLLPARRRDWAAAPVSRRAARRTLDRTVRRPSRSQSARPIQAF